MNIYSNTRVILRTFLLFFKVIRILTLHESLEGEIYRNKQQEEKLQKML